MTHYCNARLRHTQAAAAIMRHAPLRHDALSCWQYEATTTSRDKKFKAKNLEKERERTRSSGKLPRQTRTNARGEDGNQVFQGHPVLKVFSTAALNSSVSSRTPYASQASCQGLKRQASLLRSFILHGSRSKVHGRTFPPAPWLQSNNTKSLRIPYFFFLKSKTYDFILLTRSQTPKPNFTLVFWEP